MFDVMVLQRSAYGCVAVALIRHKTAKQSNSEVFISNLTFPDEFTFPFPWQGVFGTVPTEHVAAEHKYHRLHFGKWTCI